MDWSKMSKEVKRKFHYLIVLYEEVEALRRREQTDEIKIAIAVLQMRCKEVREELSQE